VDAAQIAGLRIVNASSMVAGSHAFDVALLPALAHPAAVALAYDTPASDVFIDGAELYFELSLEPASGLDIPGVPVFIIADDLDGDLDIDLAIGLPGSPGNIRTLRNNGGGSFPLPDQSLSGGGNDAQAAVGGDFDFDGDIDLALANAGNETVSIHLNDGDGDFSQAAAYAVGADPVDVAAGYFNGDTDIDLIVASMSADSVSTLHGGIGAGFAAGTVIGLGAAGDGPIRVAPATIDDADLNRQDFAVLAAGAGAVGLYVNNGAASFTLSAFRAVPAAPVALAAADLDGDGYDDIITASDAPLDPMDQVSILVNRFGAPGGTVEPPGSPGGTVEPPVNLPLAATPRAIIAADLDGDDSGDAEVAILAEAGGVPRIHVLRNDGELVSGEATAAGSGTVALAPAGEVPVDAGAMGLAAADLDGVNGPDLITINATGGLRPGPAPELSIAMNSTISTPACPGDCAANLNGTVNVGDLLALLAQWGGDGRCDLNNDNVVNVNDLLALLAAWGACP
jgi:hypothetical protein